MSLMAPEALAGHKRKRIAEKGVAGKRSKSKSSLKAAPTDGDEQSRILLLESQITESRRHYNNITELVKLAKDDDAEESATLAIVALCRVFCRLHAAGSMKKSKGLPDSEIMIIQWLKERYKEYTEVLLQLLTSGKPVLQSTALTLAMRLAKEEIAAQKGSGEDAWRHGLFFQLVHDLLASSDTENSRDEFVEKFIEEYDDVRFYALNAVASSLKESTDPKEQEIIAASSLSILLNLEGLPESKDDLESFYGPEPENKHQLYSLSAHKRKGQDAWLALFRSGLNKDQRKSVLSVLTYKVTPWFSKVEMLMDFLTDSYNVGGATSLLALSGLFYLIKEKNLDYPSFYTKLYSLLDDGILHSKHRSRFFRLLDEFMSSTHLPAALVASFIKRLSRLALHGPPAGIVVVVPWIYNMLMKHPACTFMIHRVIRDPEMRKKLEDEGMDDPFSMEETDPMETNAIESSLWELETLQSHYHPNVATLAKIISEQFTKRSYNLEDFLDHSYNGLIEAEFGKEIKKTPVVEYEIPKRIFTAEDSELGPLGGLMAKVLETC